MNNTQKVAFNTAVQLLGKAVTVATSVLIIAYLTRYLGVEGYGDYATVFAYLGIFGTVVDLGLFVVAVREIAKTPHYERVILGNMLGLKIGLGLLVFGIAYGLTWGLPYSSLVRQGILLGVVAQFFMSLNQVPLGSFQANLIMYKATFSDVVGRLLMLGLVWWFIREGGGLIEMVLAVVLTNITVFSLNVVMVGVKYWLIPLFHWIWWREIFMAALPLGVVMILGMIYFRVDILLLAAMKGSFAVGIYSAPYKVLEVLLAVPTIFMSSVLPIITTTLQRSVVEARRIFQRAFNFLSLLALPLIVGAVVIATPVMVLVAGQEFTLSGSVLKILIFALGGSFLNSVMIYAIMAANQQQRLISPYIAAVIFNVSANLIFIPRFSFWAAATVTVLTELWVLLASIYIAQKHLQFSIDWRVFGRILASSLVMGAVLYYLRDLPVGWLIVIGMGIYVTMIMTTRAISWKEVVDVLPRLSSISR